MVLLFPLLLATCAPGQSAPADVELARVSRAYDTAITQRNLSALEKFIAPGAVFTTATGRVMERAAVLEMLAAPDTHYESVESDDIKRRITGDVAVETGRVKVQGKRKGQPVDETQRYTDVWVRQNGSWRLIAEHTSLIPKGP